MFCSRALGMFILFLHKINVTSSFLLFARCLVVCFIATFDVHLWRGVKFILKDGWTELKKINRRKQTPPLSDSCIIYNHLPSIRLNEEDSHNQTASEDTCINLPVLHTLKRKEFIPLIKK